jgi:hypothetical protein
MCDTQSGFLVMTSNYGTSITYDLSDHEDCDCAGACGVVIEWPMKYSYISQIQAKLSCRDTITDCHFNYWVSGYNSTT